MIIAGMIKFMKDRQLIAFTNDKATSKSFKKLRKTCFDNVIKEEDVDTINYIENHDKEIVIKKLRTYNNKKWFDIYVPMTICEAEIIDSVITSIETRLTLCVWTDYKIFNKPILSALDNLGLLYYSNMIHGIQNNKIKQNKCLIDDLKVFMEYFV